MAKTREIKKRIKAVGNIRRITKTMQMIATAKFAASNQRTVAAKPYSAAMLALVNEVAGGLDDVTHPLVDSGKGQRQGKELTLVLTSDTDNMVPNAFSSEIAEGIAGAKLVVIPDCGHLPQLETPEAMTAALLDWLAM